MKCWFWCTSCNRVFEREVSDRFNESLARRLGGFGLSDAFGLSCPYEDCEDAHGGVLLWHTIRQLARVCWAEELPEEPMKGVFYCVAGTRRRPWRRAAGRAPSASVAAAG